MATYPDIREARREKPQGAKPGIVDPEKRAKP
jgi:hypothetical protein